MDKLNDGWRAQIEQSLLLQRWRALAPREQLSLTLLAAFLGLVLLYVALWQPAQQRMLSARTAFETQRDLYAYLHSHAPLARSLSGTTVRAVEPERLQGVVTSSVGAQGLSIERLESEGDGALQVNLQAAPFSRLLHWFTLLQEQGVDIVELALERTEDSQVVARLSLRAAR